jgi:hypothetical protein
MAPTVSTDRLRTQIDCFNPEAKATRDLKIVIKNLIEADRLEGEDLREALAEDLPAEILFSWENMGASGSRRLPYPPRPTGAPRCAVHPSPEPTNPQIVHGYNLPGPLRKALHHPDLRCADPHR